MKLCQNCGKREGTETFVKDGGVLAYVHGGFAMWCKRCVLQAQLDHARAMAAEIPGLEAVLAKECDDD